MAAPLQSPAWSTPGVTMGQADCCPPVICPADACGGGGGSVEHSAGHGESKGLNEEAGYGHPQLT